MCAVHVNNGVLRAQVAAAAERLPWDDVAVSTKYTKEAKGKQETDERGHNEDGHEE